MENRKTPSNKKIISIQEERLLRQVDYDSIPESSPQTPKKIFLEIIQKGSNSKHLSQKVLISIKPKSPTIKTVFLAEKNRFYSKKSSEKSGSRLALGDHSSFTTYFSDNESSTLNSEIVQNIYENRAKSEIFTSKNSTCATQENSTIDGSKCIFIGTISHNSKENRANCNPLFAKKCFVCTQSQFKMNNPNVPKLLKNKYYNKSNKVDIGTFIATKSSTEFSTDSLNNINTIYQRIAHLERKVLRQEMVFRSINSKIDLSSSDDDYKDCKMKHSSNNDRPGCSYVEYSHIPKTSAFQKHSQQAAPLSASKATTIQKVHNSEQYGRDFALYDGMTSRGKRQCASVPCKRDNGQKLAADRVHKIRHKLNPVRDYRLMDTVHYLAQGEFAPRDDGIKLTPSREAVLSDIIWEDVCRTHWPNTRLARRTLHSERCGGKSDLQRLIDGLLRERIAHLERRRRRHYRVVKLNHRHENYRSAGKTGDIIVANHKNEDDDKDRIVITSDQEFNDFTICKHKKSRRNSKNFDHIKETRQNRQFRQENCNPGPSNAVRHSTTRTESTCCYSSNPMTETMTFEMKPAQTKNNIQILSSDSSNTSKIRQKSPRLVIKKNSSGKKFKNKEPNLEHFILLPTLVVKTSSNIKRQKKFNELYHRILNFQLNKDKNGGNNNKNLPENHPDKK